MKESKIVKGYKVFEPDWTCRGFQYTCPGTFEEDVIPSVCERGFHFCVKAVDCFKYYQFDSNFKVAEVIAIGDMDSDGTKSCTNKIQIVREIPWQELLEIVNTGERCTGLLNSGNGNSGNWNGGGWNSGVANNGSRNSGDWNSGDWNSGNTNSGSFNSGNRNIGDGNTGFRNKGSWNSGCSNTGDFNSGNWNSGNRNSGDWNKTSFSAGCFCTEEPKILLFNKPSDWTMHDWLSSDAHHILQTIPASGSIIEYVHITDMTEQEKADHPEAKTTGGYVKILNQTGYRQSWWHDLSAREKSIVKAIPNFDKEIFKEITGIDVG